MPEPATAPPRVPSDPGRARPWLARDGLRTGAAVLVCLAAALYCTWPMAAHLTTRLGGDPGDPFQTLWSWRWMHDALASLRNPFFTDRVFHPQGASLVFQTFDLPTAVLTVPLWWVVPPFGVYNLGVLFAFWLTAFGMYRLVRELTGDTLVALCAGVLFTATPYHLAHVQGHQHLVSMGWLPLYLVHLHRMLEGRARGRDALLGGLFLALAALASWYHLLFALVLTPVLFADAAVRGRFRRPFLAQALLLAATFLAVAGPLLLAILQGRASEPVAGAHDAVRFSGDLQAFFFPNLAQGWSQAWGAHAWRWSGNAAETALYAGYMALAAALLGAVIGGGVARAYLAIALVGALLALGPYLHLGGQVHSDVPLPYLLLEKVLPPIRFMGVPVRFGYLLYLGLLVAAAFGLAGLRARWAPLANASLAPFSPPRGGPSPRRGRASRVALALVPSAVLLAEYSARPFIETAAPVPAPMLAWARDPAPFAVLDLSDPYRMMWHATLHRKPITGGNLTRVPERLERWYEDLPIVRALRHPVPSGGEVFSRRDGPLDFAWGAGPPDPRLHPDRFAVEWTGRLRVPRSGEWTFFLTSDDGARLSLDGALAVDNSGIHPMVERASRRELTAGEHAIRVSYEEQTEGAGIRLEWAGPGQPRETIPATALVAPDGGAGLRGSYRQGQLRCGLDAAQAREWLRALNVRYVVTGLEGHECLAREVELPEVYRGEGVRIYQVPSEERRASAR